MSAERLREAAALMRELAEKAEAQSAVGVRVEGVWLRSRFYMTTTPERERAVADWLERTATLAPPDPHHGDERCETCENVTEALAVANAYLGDPS